MNGITEQDLKQEGERVLGSAPPDLEARLGRAVRRDRTIRIRAAVAALAAILLIGGYILTRAPGQRSSPESAALGTPDYLNVALISPPEESPIHLDGEPICAAIYPPLLNGVVRVYFDEQDLTSIAERNDHFIILDPPRETAAGPHLLRLELIDQEGKLRGEPTWVIYIL